MCGICGIIDKKGHLSPRLRRERVLAMNQKIYHRGPDDEGQLETPDAHLAMRRLSIIDLAGGQQPVYNETGEVGVVFNGEIYNYPALRTALLKKGHRFQTDADTEVLVHLYEDHGIDMLPLLKGMFAFCLYDTKANSYLLARDRFGEKPLYYHYGNGVFSFASEPAALLENTDIERRLNNKALPYYLRTSLVPEPMTLLAQIYSVRPGQFIQLDDSGLRKGTYFEVEYSVKKNTIDEEAAEARIEPLLRQSVERQLLSDVPLGAFLSGGIDSSSVVALMQQQSNSPVQTFNVRFEDQAYDESKIARKVAAHCGTDHHEILIPNLDFDESIFWTIIDHVGLPFRDSSAIPTFLISREIRKQVKVALSGDGGDELFGGYAVFQWYQKISQLRRVPRPIRAMANTGIDWLQNQSFSQNASALRKLKRGVHTSLIEEEEIPIALNEFFSPDAVKDLLGDRGHFADGQSLPDLTMLKAYPAAIAEYSALRKIMYYRLKHTLPANMLVKVDRMSMANSLEVRSPFLDPDLFEATRQLPDNLLVRNGKGKYLLRKIMRKYLPDEVFDHPKQGFNIPLFKYQNAAFRRLAQRLLFEENPWPGRFAKAQLEQIYLQGIEVKRDTAQISAFQAAHQLWMMMQLLGWALRFNVKWSE